LSQVDDVRKFIPKIVEFNKINYNKFNEEIYLYNSIPKNNIERRGNLRGINLNENQFNQVNMRVINNLTGEKSTKNINSFRKNIQYTNNNLVSYSNNMNLLILSNNNKGNNKYQKKENNNIIIKQKEKNTSNQIQKPNNNNIKRNILNRPSTSNLSLHHKKSLSLNNSKYEKNSFINNTPLFKKSPSSKTIKITPLSISYQSNKMKNKRSFLQKSFSNFNFSPLFINQKINNTIKNKRIGKININNSLQIIPKTPQFKMSNDFLLKFKMSNSSRIKDKNQNI
jgi:hypothetical protein